MRNVSLATGRPVSVLRTRSMIESVLRGIAVFVATGRVASATRAHVAPSASDLRLIGLGDVAGLRKPTL